MRVLVLGAGLIGVATAYYLARRGHEVAVVDRRDAPAEETSLANGGQISVSHTDPWPSPENLRKVFGWIGREDAPLLLRIKNDPKLWDWCARFLWNCTSARAKRNTERMLRIALHSLEKLTEVRREYDLDFDHAAKGILHLFRDPKAFRFGATQAELVSGLGCSRNAVEREDCLRIEPALTDTQEPIIGGFHCPDDETGDAHTFSLALSEICRSMGVEFRLDTSVAGFATAEDSILGVETTVGTMRADVYVVAMGSYSPLITNPIGVWLPVYPAKGYSVTLPITKPEKAPQGGIIDDERKLVYSRLGSRLRIAGMAEIAGYDTRIDEKRSRAMLDNALSLFPGVGEPDKAEFWAGLRPQTPDSVPIIGPTGYGNLYLNTGHGTLGWTMACGSGDLLADLIEGRVPVVDMDGLGVDRFRNWNVLRRN